MLKYNESKGFTVQNEDGEYLYECLYIPNSTVHYEFQKAAEADNEHFIYSIAVFNKKKQAEVAALYALHLYLNSKRAMLSRAHNEQMKELSDKEKEVCEKIVAFNPEFDK